jgi:pyruvate/2-oxoglutarate/acetoin dehydrogenase E1 component
VMPTTPHDAKGLMISSIEDNNPVIFIEHRWLYGISEPVPEGKYRVPLGKANRLRKGSDVTIVATAYMTVEALRAEEVLRNAGITADVIDVRTVKPLDTQLILESVRKTGRLIVADSGWKTGGFGAEVLALAVEKAHGLLKCPPVRVASPDGPTPTSPALAGYYYPLASDITAAVTNMLGISVNGASPDIPDIPLDIPDRSFAGPF